MAATHAGAGAVAVFCGSRVGRDPRFAEAARRLGDMMASGGHTLVYGGGKVGLMGILADAALAAGGQVVGVIPKFLAAREIAHGGLTDIVVVDSMHARKRRMLELADAAVMLPGGLGTLDETIELLTWRQLGLHDKPVIICNIAGWADPMLALFAHLNALGFADAPAVEIVPNVAALTRCLSGGCS